MSNLFHILVTNVLQDSFGTSPWAYPFPLKGFKLLSIQFYCFLQILSQPTNDQTKHEADPCADSTGLVAWKRPRNRFKSFPTLWLHIRCTLTLGLALPDLSRLLGSPSPPSPVGLGVVTSSRKFKKEEEQANI